MKYKSTPNLLVKIKINAKKCKYVQFDSDGIFETNDTYIIDRFNGKFESIENMVIEEPKPIHEPLYKCKKCEFSTDNKGALLAHYREHKGE